MTSPPGWSGISTSSAGPGSSVVREKVTVALEYASEETRHSLVPRPLYTSPLLTPLLTYRPNNISYFIFSSISCSFYCTEIAGIKDEIVVLIKESIIKYLGYMQSQLTGTLTLYPPLPPPCTHVSGLKESLVVRSWYYHLLDLQSMPKLVRTTISYDQNISPCTFKGFKKSPGPGSANRIIQCTVQLYYRLAIAAALYSGCHKACHK